MSKIFGRKFPTLVLVDFSAWKRVPIIGVGQKRDDGMLIRMAIEIALP